MWQHLQCQLLPTLQEELGDLGEKDRLFVEVISLLPLGRFVERYSWQGIGCPPASRTLMLHAFIAKEVYQFPTREALLDGIRSRPLLRRLCGWDSLNEIPSSSTFCRAFARFAADALPQQIHEQLIRIHCSKKLVGHVSRDSTAIAAPDRTPLPSKPVAGASKPGTAERRRPGRPRKGEEKPPAEPKRLELQPNRSLKENLADLPTRCDSGAKRGSKGHMEYWRGYKLHLDVIDGDIPVSAILTSASTHDSQVAIPLMQLSSQRVHSLYQLMDAAYDAGAIHEYARSLGHVPIIEPSRKGEWIPLDPAQRRRFAERSACERVNSRLKEHHGGRNVRVRGAAKVMCHLMFGVLVIAAQALWQRLC